MHHKKKKPSSTRGGSKWNKPWKLNGFAKSRPDGERFGDHRRRHFADLAVKLARRFRGERSA